MGQKTDAELRASAIQIRNETQTNQNTALRVGEMLADFADSKANAFYGSGIIPVPIIAFKQGGASVENPPLEVHFGGTSFDFTKHNPELFLFRYRKSHRKKIIPTLINAGHKIIRSGWTHPTTMGNGTKWQGWKFFCGGQNYFNHEFPATPHPIENRVTEWAVPATIKPFQKLQIDFNRFMFWITNTASLDGASIAINPDADISYVRVVRLFTIDNPVNVYNGLQFIRIAGSKLKKNIPRFSKSQKFALALAIDNPLATKTNGLCPKIFGELSEPFYTALQYDKITKAITDVVFVKGEQTQHLHIFKKL